MLKLYDSTKNEPEIKEHFVHIIDEPSHLLLMLVKKNGDPVTSGSLLRIDKANGTVYRYSSINKNCGLALDAIGRLRTNP